MKLINEIIMFSYIFWYFQYLKIYCSHCRLGAASLMDSHIDSTSEKRKSANICQNMIYQIPPRLKRNLYKIRNAWFGICSDWSQNHQIATLIYGMAWVSWIAMFSPLFYILYANTISNIQNCTASLQWFYLKQFFWKNTESLWYIPLMQIDQHP